jgi:hypothetical protein
MFQEPISLLDIGTLVAILSAASAIFGLILTWILENRTERRARAMDAIANRLLPYYSSVLEAMGSITLFLYFSPTVEYDLLRVNPKELYDRAGAAFVYMRDTVVRQHALNTIQILEAIDILQHKDKSQELAAILPNVLPLLDTMKHHIEEYLEHYATTIKVPSLDLKKHKAIVQSQSEEVLKSIIQKAKS